MCKINVSLYGGKSIFGGKEEPLRAETISCSEAENCSLYKEGKCLNCANRAAVTANCPVGIVRHERGYTHRAARYLIFKERIKNDTMYNKLSYPDNCDFAVLGDGTLFFRLYYVRAYKPTEKQLKEDHYSLTENGYTVDDRGLSNTYSFIPKDDVSIELLYRIFSYNARAMFGGIITDYQNKVVPNVLNAMRKIAPELYNKLIEAHPDLKDRVPDYRGRYAYINSLRDGLEINDGSTKGIKQGNKILVEKLSSSFLPFNCKNAKCELEIDDQAVIRILDNNWVDDNTKFE